MNQAQRSVELAQIRPGDHITVTGWPPAHEAARRVYEYQLSERPGRWLMMPGGVK